MAIPNHLPELDKPFKRVVACPAWAELPKKRAGDRGMPRASNPGPCRALAYAGVVALVVVLVLASPRPASADDGYATWYGPGFQGHPMYNGQIYDMYDPTTTAC